MNCKSKTAVNHEMAEKGYVMVAAIFILAILAISATAIATLSGTESGIVKNERLYLTGFYECESANIDASTAEFATWLDFLNSSPSNGYKYKKQIAEEFGAQSGATIEVLRVDKSYANLATAPDHKPSAFAASLPVQKHVDDPLIGSGTGVTGEVQIQRFAITSTPTKGELQLQSGVYKYIPGENQ